jgi:voltage-gated potassium channel
MKKKITIRKIFYGISSFFSKTIVKISLLLLSIILILSALIFFIEYGKNQEIKSFFDSIYYTVVSITSTGYGDITAQTMPGRLIIMLGIIAGLLTLSLFTGTFASIFVDIQLKRQRGDIVIKNIKNHFIVAGWKTDFIGLLTQILNMNKELEPSNIVLVNNETEQTMQLVLSEPKFNGINYLHGEYFDENVLKKASCITAKELIVLADDTGRISQSEIDSKTVITVLTAKSLNKSIYTCAELYDEKFSSYLKKSYCDEIILLKNTTHLLISQASMRKGFSQIFEELINPKKGNQLVSELIPEKFHGKPYRELFNELSLKELLPLGIIENAGNVFLRKKNALKEAQKTPDIGKLVNNLKSIKELKANDPIFNPPLSYIIKPESAVIYFTPIKIKED